MFLLLLLYNYLPFFWQLLAIVKSVSLEKLFFLIFEP